MPDGSIGPKTLASLNTVEEEFFKLAYAMAKVARYESIVSKDRSQDKFLLGWIRRVLKEVS